ncbi:hypothetical protein KIV45_17025 [Janthinobacterium lividum]|nr:hypothetical protein KIV45_17025 [Janthinobacterium lividum]
MRKWLEDALCYEVAAVGQPDILGLVTPYGRWIVPLSLNVTTLGVYHAHDGWITFATADAPDAHGVLDLNGTVVLPPAPGALNVISPHLVQQIDRDGASRLLRLPDGTPLFESVYYFRQRDDGYIDIQRQTHDDERNVCGVIDVTGKVVLPNAYSSVQDFGKKKKIAIVSQRIDGRFLFGLANIQGSCWRHASTKPSIPPQRRRRPNCART